MTERMGVLDGVVPGVFADTASAEAAIAELREMGFGDDELGVIVADPAHHRLLDDPETETLKGLKHGILVGTPLGVLGGLALAALAPHEVLVAVVTDPERAKAVCEAMQRHGARCVRDRAPRSTA